MISLNIGNTDLSGYITKIRFERSPYTKLNNSFINYDGTEICGEGGRFFKTVIPVTAEGVPESTAAALDAVLHSESFNVTYTSPAGTTGTFICTSYSAEPDEGSHEDGSTPDWNLNFTIESASPESTGSGL